MASQEYMLALGENRWAFADADYAFVFLLMTIDREYQVLVDRPKSFKEMIKSGDFSRHFRSRVFDLEISDELKFEAENICTEWATLAERRNNLAHAWGYSDAGVSQLGGYSHRFPKNGEPVHIHMTWPIENVREMTASCKSISSRITTWRSRYESETESD